MARLIEEKYLDDEKFARFGLSNGFMKKERQYSSFESGTGTKGDNTTIGSLVMKNIRSDDEEFCERLC